MSDKFPFTGLIFLLLLGFFVGVMTGIFLDLGYPNLNETNESLEPSFGEVYIYCNQELYNYTLTNKDYLQCLTPDECELKNLKYDVIIQRNYQCFEYFWELKDE